MQARRRADADTPLAAEAETEHLGSPSPCRATESTDPPEGTFPTAAAAVADPSSAVQAPLSNHARSENALKRSRVGVTARRNLDVARSFSAWTKDDYSTRKKRTRREDHED